MFNDFLSYLLKEIRKKENLTQKEIANILDKSEISIRKYESGSYPVPMIIFFILFMRFKYNYDYFIALVNGIEKDFNFFVTSDMIEKFNSELKKYNIDLDTIDKLKNDNTILGYFSFEFLPTLINNDIHIYPEKNELIKVKINNDTFEITDIKLKKIIEILKNNLVNDFKSMIELEKSSNK